MFTDDEILRVREKAWRVAEGDSFTPPVKNVNLGYREGAFWERHVSDRTGFATTVEAVLSAAVESGVLRR